ncbi:uncharacterized protein V1516DRAFT_657409 [Lipomyces oligophaga]|uniref:uncharacterized protein n=1 Tax=Lipomyces oligophaga TaxID=45792 RepID=UPI0034CDE1F1
MRYCTPICKLKHVFSRNKLKLNIYRSMERKHTVGNGQRSIQSYLEQVQSTADAINLVDQATSSPDLFTFAFLINSPILNSFLSGLEYRKYLNLVRLFAYGTWEEYTSNQTSFPELNEAQATKLKQLTVITLAGREHRLKYSDLLSALDLENSRQIAQLIISCIYASLITARLDTQAQLVLVDAVIAGRDVVEKKDIERLKTVIDGWSMRCQDTMDQLSVEIRRVRHTTIKELKEVTEYNKTVESINQQLTKSIKVSSKSGSKDLDDSISDDHMDIDSSPASDAGFTKKRKQRTVS